MLSVSSSTHALKAGSHVILQSLILTCHKRLKSFKMNRYNSWIRGRRVLGLHVQITGFPVQFAWNLSALNLGVNCENLHCLKKVVPQRPNPFSKLCTTLDAIRGILNPTLVSWCRDYAPLYLNPTTVGMYYLRQRWIFSCWWECSQGPRARRSVYSRWRPWGSAGAHPSTRGWTAAPTQRSGTGPHQTSPARKHSKSRVKVRSHWPSTLTLAAVFASNFNFVSMVMFTLMQRMSIEHLTPLLLLFSKIQTQTLTLTVDESLALFRSREGDFTWKWLWKPFSN